MSLSAEQTNFNQRELKLIETYFESLYGSSEKLTKIMAIITNYLDTNAFFLSVPDGNKLLEDIVSENLAKKKINEDYINVQLQAWANRYQDLEAALSLAGQTLHAEQPRGIIRSLEQGHDPTHVWMEDGDIRIALMDEIIDPGLINAAGIHILPPVGLTEPPLSAEGKKTQAYTPFEEDLKTVLEQNPFANMTLLRCVNAGQNHWMTAVVEVQQGKIISASLIDSMPNSSLAQSSAYKNMQIAVNNAQPKDGRPVTVQPNAEGVQKNGYSCGDYSVKKVLQLKYANANPDPALLKIRDAGGAQPKALRENVIEAIITHHIHLREAKETLRRIQQEIEKTADDVTKAQTLMDQLHTALKADPGLQVQFDAIMAKKLEELYHKSKEPEGTNLEVARAYAFEQLLKKFGLFRVKQARPAVQELQPHKKPRN